MGGRKEMSEEKEKEEIENEVKKEFMDMVFTFLCAHTNTHIRINKDN